LEITMNTMNTKTTVINSKLLICIPLLAACGLLSAQVQAKSQEVTVKISVSTADLDLSQPTGAREAYVRLQRAAYIACTHGARVGLQPPASFADCYEKALGDAIRSVHVPRLTHLYLETHSLREAAAHGIALPVQVAAK
jgi:UrcA family protein